MSDSHIPYQERVEGCMFILLGKLYDKCYKRLILEEIFEDVEEQEYKDEPVFNHAVDALLAEGFIRCSTDTKEFGGARRTSNPQLTQEGREWYQEQIEKKQSKWKKLLKYIGKRVLDKTIDSVS